MKKWVLMFGVAIGFILGSKAGRKPYKELEGKVRELGARPDVQKAIKTVTKRAHEQAGDVASTVHDRVSDLADKVGQKLPTSVGSNGS